MNIGEICPGSLFAVEAAVEETRTDVTEATPCSMAIITLISQAFAAPDSAKIGFVAKVSTSTMYGRPIFFQRTDRYINW